MKRSSSSKNISVDPHAAMSTALSEYHFATPEIRSLMRQVLGDAPSGRTIKRMARCRGTKLRRGRPPTTPRVYRKDVPDLIEATSRGLGAHGGNAVHFFHEIHQQFELTPRQYIEWLGKSFRRGKCMMRRCLLCGELFPSLDSGERHCEQCQGQRRRRLSEERKSLFV